MLQCMMLSLCECCQLRRVPKNIVGSTRIRYLVFMSLTMAVSASTGGTSYRGPTLVIASTPALARGFTRNEIRPNSAMLF